jgi:hypothetical protein
LRVKKALKNTERRARKTVWKTREQSQKWSIIASEV